MDITLYALIAIIPTVAVVVITYFLITKFFNAEEQKRKAELKRLSQEVIIPIKLQAYERVVLYLERISPYTLVMRVNQAGMTARFLHAELLKTIRTEFDHNVAQQLYLSANAWEMTKNAKDEITKLINIAATKIPDNASGMDLNQVIIELSSGIAKLPNSIAIDYIKKEMATQF